MKKLFTLLLVTSSLATNAQTNYWQQQCDYKIEVSLNDSLNELNGFITIDYKNNSPQSLNYILFHLWPNAYKDLNTPFAKQEFENGNTRFYFSKPEQRGYIDQLNFKLNAEACVWSYDSVFYDSKKFHSEEIAKLFLNSPLKTGESVRVTTPFHVKLPNTFSRMGHVGQSYQITQWYPKPAVFDKYGWHAIPYLDQGEFYSEYGSFDVSITLPKNYVVGATGDLQNENELKWLDSISEATKKITDYDDDMKFPRSSSETKTLRYTQKNIHDFGWFADKRFHVLKGEVELPHSKRKVTTWNLFTNNQADYWKKASEYIHDAVYYYSDWIGDYPYAQVTAVDGALSAGGGMEYPNVTVIGPVRSAFSLDDVITHEVGHNWFYGILGSNERDHAWMDEGINSYYEFRYVRTKYPNRKMLGRFPDGVAKALNISQYKYKYLMDLANQIFARENLDQPLEITSADFTQLNYGINVYGKTMLLFDYLEAYLGTEIFDKAMKKYFEEWKFKHPQPEDIRKILETETGKNLGWLFDDLIKTKKRVDYSVAKAKKEKCADCFTGDKTVVKLKNKGGVASPVIVSEMKNDSVIQTHVIEGFAKDTTVTLYGMETNRIKIDNDLKMPELNRKNNTYKLNRAAHKFEKLRFQFLGSLENQKRSQICWLPYIGGNNYDKVEVGLVFHNNFLPSQKFNYVLAPAIGTGSKQFIGFGKLAYNFYPEKNIQRFTVGVAGKRYSYLRDPQTLMFNKVEPFINIEFKKRKARSVYTHSLNMRSAVVWLDWMNFDKKKETQRYYVNEIQYRFERNATMHPMKVNVTFQQGDKFAALFTEGNFRVSYKRKDEGFFIRVFAGGFPAYFKNGSDISAPLPKLYLSNVTNNTFAYWLQKDYMFDENFLDRNGRSDILGRQVAKTMGGFRSITTFGATSKFLATVNLTSSTHRFFPINPFVNAGVVLNDLKKVDLVAEAGVSLILLRDMFEIHLPLVTTKNISDNQKLMGIDKWYKKFTFTLKLQLQKPLDLIRRFIG